MDSDNDGDNGFMLASMPTALPSNPTGPLPAHVHAQASVDLNLPVMFAQDQAADEDDQNTPANPESTSPTRMEVDDLPVAGDRAEDEFWPENANDMMDLDVGHVE